MTNRVGRCHAGAPAFQDPRRPEKCGIVTLRLSHRTQPSGDPRPLESRGLPSRPSPRCRYRVFPRVFPTETEAHLTLSDRCVFQAVAHGFLSLRMALMIVTSLHSQAIMSTLAGFPEALRR